MSLYKTLLIQECIKNDIRVFVIGAETTEPVIFAYKRYALGNDFRSNYSISHEGEKVEITDEERTMALDAARLMGMPVCGVDIMRDANDSNKPGILFRRILHLAYLVLKSGNRSQCSKRNNRLYSKELSCRWGKTKHVQFFYRLSVIMPVI